MSWRISAAENLPFHPSKPTFPNKRPHHESTSPRWSRDIFTRPHQPVSVSLRTLRISPQRPRRPGATSMSRSAADATRFTATGPYASSKPKDTPYELPDFLKPKEEPAAPEAPKPKGPQPGPNGQPETPKQKVERLRAQARAARMAQSSSGVDRWIEVGRRFANRAHKGMVYSLIAASGMCLAVLGFPVPTPVLRLRSLSPSSWVLNMPRTRSILTDSLF